MSVGYIDVIGTKKEREPATLMRGLHALVTKVKSQLASIDHAYTWNDCVLLISFPNRQVTYSAAMRDAETLKRRIDVEVAKSYAIAVKGQAFPPMEATIGTTQISGVTVIKASSWAMANCFEIERESKEGKWGKPWYVDSRIAGRIQTRQCFDEKTVLNMLGAGGKRQPRTIRAFSGYLWGSGVDE